MKHQFFQKTAYIIVSITLLMSSFANGQLAVADTVPTPTRIPGPTQTPITSGGSSQPNAQIQSQSILSSDNFTTSATTQSTSTTRGIDAESFIATFFDAPHLIGSPIVTKAYTQPIDFFLDCGAEVYPYNGCKLTNELTDGYEYSVQWAGQLVVPSTGAYTFRLNYHDDGVQLFIDSNLVADSGWNFPNSDARPDPQTVNLLQGDHVFRINFEQRVPSVAALQVRWAGPGFGEETIPLFSAASAVNVTVTDSQGNPVSALRLNDDGWPTENASNGALANPLTVAVTLSCPAVITECAYPLTIDFGATSNVARFYVVDVDIQNETAPAVGCEVPASSNSFRRLNYDCFSPGNPDRELILSGGQSKQLSWHIWVQPSDLTYMRFYVRWWGMTGSSAGVKNIFVPRAAIHPIVFLPGLGATNPPITVSAHDDIQIPLYMFLGDTLAGYDKLYSALEKLGYERNRTYLIFPYDWLQDTAKTALKLYDPFLKNAARTIASTTEGVPWIQGYGSHNGENITFDFIGHSTGNLVARAYIQTLSDERWNDFGRVRKYVSLAGPHKGLPKGYAIFEGVSPDDSCNPLEQSFDITCLALKYAAARAAENDYLSWWDEYLAWKFSCAGVNLVFTEVCVNNFRLEDRYRFAHDPVVGPTSAVGFLPTYSEVAFLQSSVPFPFGRPINTLLESQEALGPQVVTIGGNETYITNYDPYLDNPVTQQILRERYPLFSYSYGGLNTPQKMELFADRLNGSQNICLVFAGVSDESNSGVLTTSATAEFDTRVQINVYPPGNPLWRYGAKPSNSAYRWARGDELIPLISAGASDIWVNGEPIRFDLDNELFDDGGDAKALHGSLPGYGLTHRHIAQCLIGPALDFLQDETDSGAPFVPPSFGNRTRMTGLASQFKINAPQITPELETASRSLLISAFGPVKLTLTDELGRRLGYNPTSSTSWAEIPNGFATTDTELGIEYILVYSPEYIDYTLTITGIGEGEYGIVSNYSDTTGDVPYFFKGYATLGLLGEAPFVVPEEAIRVPQPPDVSAGFEITGTTSLPVEFPGYAKDPNPDDVLSFAWDFGDESVGASTLNPSHPYASAGVFTATLTVADNQGFVVSDTVRVLISSDNVAPQLGHINAPINPIQVNTPIQVNVSFSDPNTNDSHTAVWNWGDGSIADGVILETNGIGTVSGTHTYTTPGVYTIRLALDDNQGALSEAQFEYVVIYDPNGGFVTGGGWIMSPIGAYAPDPTLTSRANFGFVSKYHKGSNVPTGNTEFQFQAASFKFRSTSYQWLVVAGPKAQFKGSGTINGSGDYGFMLTARDGQAQGGGGVDRFRIKIWNKTTGDVIYDNQRGDADNGDASDAIEGGSIVIHK